MIKMQQGVTVSLRLIILTAFFMSFSACGPSNSGLPNGTGTTGTTGTAGVTVSSNPTSISTYGLANITATVKDTSGNPVADGTSVTFSLSDSLMGTLSSSTATTSGGTATVNFTATNTTGSVTITSTSGSLSGSVTISIAATATGAVSLSASPSTISPSNTSAITARVVDSAGNPVVDNTTVSFTLDNPSLGSISPSSVATSNGNATGTFTASTGTGTVTITATSGTITGTLAITISGTTTSTAATNISLTATPSSIMTTATSSIQATVTTSTGATVADGTAVTFTLSSSAMGTITSSATTSSGIAGATFTAGATPGTVTITATADSVSQTVAVIIAAAANGSIEYSSATPQVIGIKGSGQTETSAIIFAVNDINGSAAVDGTSVSFTMSGPNGGEYIDTDLTPATATASTVSGNATAYLHSGSVAGPVTVTASVTTSSGTVSSTSSVVSIGGGVPSAAHFNLATTTFNLPGLVVSNSPTRITGYIADRFGNYNVLTGTSVSFYTEAGAINRSATLDATGTTYDADNISTLTTSGVLFRTQSPMPVDVSPETWETTLINNLNTTYYGGVSTIPTTTTPRDGWVKVLATVQGEESFLDENGNGVFDSSYNTSVCSYTNSGYTCQCSGGTPVSGGSSCAGGGTRSEAFIDLGEPFYDKNDNGSRDDGQTSGAPFEEFIDTDLNANGNTKTNGQYDGPNGVWDGPNCPDSGCQTSKMIWTDITVAFTGNAYYCKIIPTSFTIANAGSQSFSFMVGDINTNRLVSGTTIDVTPSSGGTTSGTTSYTILDGVPTGPTEISFTLADSDSSTVLTAAASITVTVTGSGVPGCTATASGTID